MRGESMKKALMSIMSVLMIICLPACEEMPGRFVEIPDSVTGKTSDERFISGTMDYSVSLFQKVISDNENIIMSPLSLQIALAMTANGAAGATRDEMTSLFAVGDVEELNDYMLNYVKVLTADDKLAVANSLWIKNNGAIKIKDEFRQMVETVYQAEVYKAAFDDKTVKDINTWVYKNTKGMIPKIIDSLDESTVSCLINALAFEAEWMEVYTTGDIYTGVFRTNDDREEKVEFMMSEEYLYLEEEDAVGFIKPYQDENFAFVALLPNEDILLSDYIAGLDGTKLLGIIENAQNVSVDCHLPKFSISSSFTLSDILKSMGMITAFSEEADFTNMAESADKILIDEVIQKAFIEVDELGTKAGAVTIVSIKTTSIGLGTYSVCLDRPFMYLLIDTKTDLPVFMGTVLTIEE